VKLLDYGHIYPFGPIAGTKKDLAWPVTGYRITLPQTNKGESFVNPFERLILRFIDADMQITEDLLAEETCLPQALVHGIIIRLQEHGYLDEHKHIAAEKKKNWEEGLSVSTDNYVTAIVFQDMLKGNLLPFIHFISENTPLKLVIDDDPLKYFKRLHYDESKKYPPPTPQDVLQALHEMKTRGKHRGEIYITPSISQINVMPQKEIFYLSCPIAIQKNDGDFRIADPFGNGYSMFLENIFSDLLEKDDNLAQWYQGWVSNLGRNFSGSDEERTRYSFDTPELRSKYPELILNLRPGKQRAFRSLAKIYASFEWTLFYFCRQFPCDAIVQMMKRMDEETMGERLLQISTQLGFNAKKFLFVRPGKLLDYLNGKAEMPTLIGIALMLAEQTEARAFLRRLAEKHPNFFDRIKEIKENRDSIEHGAMKQLPDRELADDPLLKETILILLPDVVFEQKTAVVHSGERAFDMKVAARNSIQSCFSFGTYNRMGDVMQQRLISAEMFLGLNEKQEQFDNVMPFVCDLYAAVQIAFRPHLYEDLPPVVSDCNLISLASEKIAEAGFSALPDYFRHVNMSRIEKTLQGQDQSLGAAAVAFILVSKQEQLSTIAMNQPEFFSDIAEIAVVRGHGNEIISKTRTELLKLKKSIYTTIKTLMEV